jgi:hypothetical protein
MGDVLVDAVPPNAVHLFVDMQRIFSSDGPRSLGHLRHRRHYGADHRLGLVEEAVGAEVVISISPSAASRTGTCRTTDRSWPEAARQLSAST